MSTRDCRRNIRLCMLAMGCLLDWRRVVPAVARCLARQKTPVGTITLRPGHAPTRRDREATHVALNGAMGAAMQPVVAALADLTDVELQALIASANDGRQTAPGFLRPGSSTCRIGSCTGDVVRSFRWSRPTLRSIRARTRTALRPRWRCASYWPRMRQPWLRCSTRSCGRSSAWRGGIEHESGGGKCKPREASGVPSMVVAPSACASSGLGGMRVAAISAHDFSASFAAASAFFQPSRP